MAPQTRHDLLRVGDDRRHEVRIVGRNALDARARLAELLPDEQTEPVAEVVELVALDQPAAPDAQQVDVRARREAEQTLELLGPRHAVQRVDRHPVPAAHRHRHAVDDEAVVVELDGAEADVEVARAVEALLAHAVRPPELRRLDAQHDLAVDLHRPDAVLERHARKHFGRRIDPDRAPDALVHEARAEVPAVPHAALVHADAARPADLRLALRRRVHRDREPVVSVRHLDPERRERARVLRYLLAVDEHRRLVVDALELDRAAAHAPTVHPRPLGDPFGEPAVALEVRVRHLTGAHEVVHDAAGHASGQPARRIPGLVHVPPPLLAEPAFHLPVVAVARHHSSKSVSRTPPSRATMNVLISFGPNSASIVRPNTSIRAVAGRPADSYARTHQAPPSSAAFTTVRTTSPPPSLPYDAC